MSGDYVTEGQLQSDNTGCPYDTLSGYATFIRCHAASSAHNFSEFIVMFLHVTGGVVGIHNNPCTRLLCASCATKLAEVLNSSRRVISEFYLPSS